MFSLFFRFSFFLLSCLLRFLHFHVDFSFLLLFRFASFRVFD